MKITLKLLHDFNACSDGIEWVSENSLINLDHSEFIEKLIINNKFGWANWIAAYLTLSNIDKVKYAILTAEQVVGIFEKQYPEDVRPRQAIASAKAYLADPCKVTATLAGAGGAYGAASVAAADAYDAAEALYDANVDAYAAYAAGYAADAAANAALAAYDAGYAADAAANVDIGDYDAADAAIYDDAVVCAADAAYHAAANAAYNAADAAIKRKIEQNA